MKTEHLTDNTQELIDELQRSIVAKSVAKSAAAGPGPAIPEPIVMDVALTDQFFERLATVRPKAAKALRDRNVQTSKLQFGGPRFALRFDFDMMKTLVVSKEEADRIAKLSANDWYDLVRIPDLDEFDTQVDSPKAVLVLAGTPAEWGLVA